MIRVSELILPQLPEILAKAITVKNFSAGLESMQKVNPSSETLLE